MTFRLLHNEGVRGRFVCLGSPKTPLKSPLVQGGTIVFSIVGTAKRHEKLSRQLCSPYSHKEEVRGRFLWLAIF